MRNATKTVPTKSRASVKMSVPKGALFVGSYHRIPIRMTGITLEKIQFVLPEGAKAAIISPSRDATFSERRPHFMLCVGHLPGTYQPRCPTAQGHYVLPRRHEEQGH